MKKTLLAVFTMVVLISGSVSGQDREPILVTADGTEHLELRALDVEVRISGLTAETELTMTFFNPGPIDIAGDLYVPLPENGVLSGYALDIDGILVDGVPVEKRKGREVFEKIVRQGIDPGLAEWTKGNTFKTRVFPIPAEGSRTVRVSYIADLAIPGGIPVYHLPMNYTGTVREFSIRVEVLQAALPPAVRESGFSQFRFIKWRAGYIAETRLQNTALDTDLYISIPPSDFTPVSVEKSETGEYFFSITDMEIPVPRESMSGRAYLPPAKLTLYWDASGSRSSSSLERSFEVLDMYFQTLHAPTINVECVVFRNETEDAVNFRIRNGNADELLSFLRDIPYDGGTQLGTLPAPGYGSSFAMLFSDGLSNFGETDMTELSVPLYIFSEDTQVNYPYLKYLAMKNHGEFFNLRTESVDEVIPRIGRSSFNFLGTRVEFGTAEEVYPELPQPVQNTFRVSGKLTSPTAHISLLYGRNGTVETERRFRIIRENSESGETLRTVWAHDKLNELMIFPERNAALISDLGKEYGIVTPGTSLIVLENLDQYVEYEIPPPRMLSDMRHRYFKMAAEKEKKEEDRQERKIDTVLSLWRERVQWWETEFSYSPNFRIDADSGGTTGAEEPSDMMFEAEEEAPFESSRAAVADEEFMEAEKSIKQDDTDQEPVIEIKAWDPSTPYLEALKAETPSTYYSEYLRQREEFGSSPAFYLDCADFFFARRMPETGLRILSNLAELELENPALLRVLAHRLEQQDYLHYSKSVFEEVLRMRPEEPQSYRDLALVCGRLMEYDRAVELLYRVVLGQWDRFDQIELVALMEMNNMIRKARSLGIRPSDFTVDPRLVKMLDLDLRVVLTWDTDLTDMDLWVIEPSGEKCYYSNNRTAIGGHLSRDFTDGYGPEEYMLRRAMDGSYDIKVDYFSSSAPALTGSVTLQVVIFTDYGRPGEKRQAVTVRLRESDDIIDIGEVEF